jgi:hypothetical protein
MSAIRVTLDLDPAGTTVSGLVAGGQAGNVDFSSWLELMQTLERLLVEAEPVDAAKPDAGAAR